MADANRILTTHAGSLIRPPELLPFIRAIERGLPYDEDAYAECLRGSVADVVRRQAEAGIDVVDDGELGKASWITYLYDRVTGLELRPAPEGRSPLPPSRDREAFPEFYAEHDARLAADAGEALRGDDEDEGAAGAGAKARGRVWVCTGPIEYRPEALRRDLDTLAAALDGVDVAGAFVPAVAPASVYWLDNEHYPDDEAFVHAVADALRQEYAAILDAGFQLQVDDAVLAHEYDSVLARGGSVDEWRRWAEVRVEALNHALRGLPSERIRYHVCFGSWHGPHVYDPTLREIVDLMLRVDAGAYSIELANPRHEHEWRLWEDVTLPEGKTLIPGVVTHHTVVVEHPELVAERIVRLARLVGREHVIAGTDCGFAQRSFLQRVHPSIQWAKLEALAEGARLATRALWGR